MTNRQNRYQDELAFVLHTHPFRETSLLLDVYSREHGRLAIVARGARRPRSALRGVLMNFQPLRLAWFGKGEVRTLHAAEWQAGQPYLQGTALMCGFYLNELLINLLARDDAHEQLFDYYRATLYRLAHETDHAATLRCFERHLLQELGYALELEREAGSGNPCSLSLLTVIRWSGACCPTTARRAALSPEKPCWRWPLTTIATRRWQGRASS